MKSIIALCSVAFLVTCAAANKDGQPSSTEDGEERFRFTASMCLTPDSKLSSKVTNAGNDCVRMAVAENNRLQFSEETTLDQAREYFENFCRRRPVVRRCLAETTANVKICQNDTFSTAFEIYRDIIETVLDVGCDEEGAKFATFMYELAGFVRSKQTRDAARRCSDRFEIMLRVLEESAVDISSKLYNVHKEIVTFVECTSRFEGAQSLRRASKNFTDVLVNGMKCVHPESGALVPCVAIDVATIKTSNVCDVKTLGTEWSLYDVLEEESGECLIEVLRYADVDVDDNARIRQQVEYECKYRTVTPYCVNNALIVAEACLNETEQGEFPLVGEAIASAYEIACVKDGRRLAEVLYEVFRLRKAGHGNAVWNCMDVATSTRNATATDPHATTTSSKNLRLYRETEAFRTCLVDKLRGDTTSVEAATSLIDEVLRQVKCVRPEGGDAMLCEILVNKT